MNQLPFAEKLFPFLNTLEKIFLTGFIIGACFRILHLNGADEFLMISMSGLAIVCFLTAYKPATEDFGNHSKALLMTIVNKMFYISSAVCILGLLFFLLHFKGYQQLLLIGSLPIGICTIIGVYLITQLSESAGALRPGLLRGLPLGIASAFVLYYFGWS